MQECLSGYVTLAQKPRINLKGNIGGDEMDHKVFISYSHEDKLIAEEIDDHINSTGLVTFIDEKNIEWGDPLSLSVNDELMSSTMLLVILSPAGMKSNWVMLEIGQAIAMGKKILPFLTHPSLEVPDLLKDTKNISDIESLKSYFSNYLDAFEKKEDKRSLKEEKKHVQELPQYEYITHLKTSSILQLKVPDLDAFTSYEPLKNKNKFLQLCVQTTDGVVEIVTDDGLVKNEKQENIVYLICDPIRPYEIQIGKTRMNRPEGILEGIELSGEDKVNNIKRLYPTIIDKSHKWMRTVIAELSTSEEVLDYIYTYDPSDSVRKVATRNPYASERLKTKECLFCNKDFLKERVIFEYNTARIFPNDYPFGPYFHYIALPSNPIHSWQNIEESHLVDMNIAIKKFLDSGQGELSLGGAVGVRVGLNSSIRHLVMGKATATAAGASIPHIHKQVWGMAISSFNLGDHLCKLCDAYEKKGIDYLGLYLNAIDENEFLIWDDENVALYIPFGQISIHELQIMVKRVGAYTYLDLTEDEIVSLSKAEFIVTRIYHELGINSFNEVMLTKTFYRDIGKTFRLILTFITREVDLAVSELNLVFVVDRLPTDTRNEIQSIWSIISEEYGLKGASFINGVAK